MWSSSFPKLETLTAVADLGLCRQWGCNEWGFAVQSHRITFHQFMFKELFLVFFASWISTKILVKLFCVILVNLTLLLWAK